MAKLNIDVAGAPDGLAAGLRYVMDDFPERFGSGGCTVSFEPDTSAQAGSLAVSTEGQAIRIRYTTPTTAFRALGRVMGAVVGGDDAPAFEEQCRLDMAGIMPDCSRNGVLSLDGAKALLRRIALMGLNMMILYTEDTYEVPGEPLFGYLRGRYTHDELKELDAYAADLGIEMFPCIQTLGHLEQVLQWDHYADYRDLNGVLLADWEPTYALLEKMITAASAPFRSNRIHIGMDEAHGIGSGRHKEQFGEKRPFDILNDHLARVREICRGLDLRPMMWSDMYFRLGTKTDDYYDTNWSIPKDVLDDIPTDVSQVYWDYYHPEIATYVGFIENHRKLGSEPIVAGGVWTWSHLWAALPWSFTVGKACVSACKQTGIREVFMTLWGDDGAECDLFSALPGLQFFAENAYADEVDDQLLRANFVGSCGADLDAYVRASGLDDLPRISQPDMRFSNPSKWLLWQDPALSFLDVSVEGMDLKRHYTQLAADLSNVEESGPMGDRLTFPKMIADVLALKVYLRRDLAAAYAAGDRDALKALADGDLQDCTRAVRDLWHRHRRLWLSIYKPFGWDTIERRYGGLIARLETLAARVNDYLAGDVDRVEELEATFVDHGMSLHSEVAGDVPYMHHNRAASPSYS